MNAPYLWSDRSTKKASFNGRKKVPRGAGFRSKTMVKSYFMNNYVIRRVDDELPIIEFHGDGEPITRMDGYVIVPKERIPDMDAFLASLLPAKASTHSQ